VNGIIRQAAKFATVGGGATLVHVAVALLAHGLVGLSPLSANFAAFLFASAFSYLLNWAWTFDAAGRHALTLPRFAGLSLACFAANQAIVFLVVELLGWPLWLAMIPVVLVIPPLGFWLSRCWVFSLPSRLSP